MYRGCAVDAFQRTVYRFDSIASGLFRSCLHPRLVELDHIDAGAEQVLDLLIYRRRIVHHQTLLVVVEIVLTLLRHGEWPRDRHLGDAVSVLAQKTCVAEFDRIFALDSSDDARYRDRLATAT